MKPVKAFIDFETRSKVNLRKANASVYAKAAEIMCLCWVIDEGLTGLWTPEYDEGVDELLDAIRNGCEVYAHNASFERAIWRHICVPKLNWPEIQNKQWYCTAAQVAAMGLPRSLDGAAAVLGLPVKKDMDGHRVMMQLARPRKPSKHNISTWVEAPEKLEKLYGYCRKDVIVEKMVHEKADKLSKSERLIWLLDQKINDRGIPIDADSVRNAIAFDQQYKETETSRLREITNGELKTAGQVEKIIKFVTERGVNIDNLTAATVAETLSDPELNPVARQVLEIRRDLSLTSTKKYPAMLAKLDPDDRIRDAHLYHGASTGRWAGKGVQFQNIARGELPHQVIDLALSVIRDRDSEGAEALTGSVPSLLSSCIRSVVCASEGKKLIVVDFASIEARVLAWLAGEPQVLQDFRDGIDVYKRMATYVYGCSIDDVTKLQRFYGKTAVLGLGYQMGAPKFQATLEGYGVVFDDLVWEPNAKKWVSQTCIDIVKVYRERNQNIRNWWYNLYDAAVDAVKTGKPQFAGKIQFYMKGRFLRAVLPNGRELYYCDPQLKEEKWTWNGEVVKRQRLSYTGVDSVTKQWVRHKTFGGKLAENITQGSSRDFLAYAMFLLERANYPTCMHVHDEAVSEVDEDYGSVEEVERIITQVPRWGKGCPLAAEGFEAKRYRK